VSTDNCGICGGHCDHPEEHAPPWAIDPVKQNSARARYEYWYTHGIRVGKGKLSGAALDRHTDEQIYRNKQMEDKLRGLPTK